MGAEPPYHAHIWEYPSPRWLKAEVWTLFRSAEVCIKNVGLQTSVVFLGVIYRQIWCYDHVGVGGAKYILPYKRFCYLNMLKGNRNCSQILRLDKPLRCTITSVGGSLASKWQISCFGFASNSLRNCFCFDKRPEYKTIYLEVKFKVHYQRLCYVISADSTNQP